VWCGVVWWEWDGWGGGGDWDGIGIGIGTGRGERGRSPERAEKEISEVSQMLDTGWMRAMIEQQ
jgi:hypothetical protein